MVSFDQIQEEYGSYMEPDHTWAGGASGVSFDTLHSYLNARVAEKHARKLRMSLEEREWLSSLGFSLDAMLQNLHLSVDGIDEKVEANLSSIVNLSSLTDDEVDNFLMQANTLRRSRADYKILRHKIIEVRHDIHQVAQPSFEEVHGYFDSVLLGIHDERETTRQRVITIGFTADFNGFLRFAHNRREQLSLDSEFVLFDEEFQWLKQWERHYNVSIQKVFNSIRDAGRQTDIEFATYNYRLFKNSRSKIQELLEISKTRL